MSKISLSAACRVGCVRANNEDMVLAYDRLIRSDACQTVFDSANSDRFVVAVADGMGGHKGGEVASETTLRNLQFFISDLPRKLSEADYREALSEWLQSINAIIESNGRSDPELTDMGTTLVGLFYYAGHYYSANCGDSRLYRLHDGRLQQLTTDHSLNNMTGQKKHSNIITNCIGAGCKNSYFDFTDITALVCPGDCFLLCSDGLNDMVPDDIIERLLAEGVSANSLCEEAIAAGGFDNVSACVLRIEELKN